MADFTFDPEAPADEDLPAPTEGVYALNEDHVVEGIAHLIELFRQGPRNQAELAAYLAQAQEVEDAFWDLFNAFDPDTAVGHQLDLIGKLIGEGRLARTDDDYRAAIRVRVLVNSSDGQPEQLIEIASAMFPSPTYTMAVDLQEFFPGSLSIAFVGDPGDVTHASVHRLLTLAKAAGVRLDTIFESPEGGDGFVWAGDTVADDPEGWGSDTDATVGGVWGSVL
jgi:hypothetical protein